MRLNLKQTRALDYLEDDITTELLFGGGAGGGKSMLGCYWQLKRRYKYPGSRGLIGRTEMKTLKETTLVSFFKVAKIQGLVAGTHFRYRDNPHNDILFPNGSLILLKDLAYQPSDPNFDGLGSLEVTDAFIDEANQCVHKAKTVLSSRIRHGLDEFGLIPKMLMGCNPAKNWVYSEFYRADRDGTIESYRKFVQALATDNPDISPHYIDNLMKMDKASKERLLYGNWEYDDDPATMIEYERILDCFSNYHLAADRSRADKISCDVARFGKDKTVIAVWFSPRHVKLFVFKGISTTETAEKLQAARIQYGVGLSRVVVDEDGVGGGVVDMVKCKGFVNNSRPLPAPFNPKLDENTGKPLPENFKNLKSQCYKYLADRINGGGLHIECDDPEIKQAITEELEQVKKANVDKDGPFEVISKDKVKEVLGRSPDYSDALMMGEYIELKPKLGVGVA
jgi:hypothetical protein